MFNYATVQNGEIAKFYTFDQLGIEQAYCHARMYGYEVWEVINGKLYAMAHSARPKE